MKFMRPNRNADRETDRQTKRQAGRQNDTQTNTETDRQAHRHTHRQTNRQKEIRNEWGHCLVNELRLRFGKHHMVIIGFKGQLQLFVKMKLKLLMDENETQ